MAKKKKTKIETVLHEFKMGKLRSGSKKGPKVKSRDQAIAIAISESDKSSKRLKRNNLKKKAGKGQPIKRKII